MEFITLFDRDDGLRRQGKRCYLWYTNKGADISGNIEAFISGKPKPSVHNGRSSSREECRTHSGTRQCDWSALRGTTPEHNIRLFSRTGTTSSRDPKLRTQDRSGKGTSNGDETATVKIFVREELATDRVAACLQVHLSNSL
ncbi:unnamed protein product [Brassica oleracea]